MGVGVGVAWLWMAIATVNYPSPLTTNPSSLTPNPKPRTPNPKRIYLYPLPLIRSTSVLRSSLAPRSSNRGVHLTP